MHPRLEGSHQATPLIGSIERKGVPDRAGETEGRKCKDCVAILGRYEEIQGGIFGGTERDIKEEE